MQLKSCFDRQRFHEKPETKGSDREKVAVTVAFAFFFLSFFFFSFFPPALNTGKSFVQKALG